MSGQKGRSGRKPRVEGVEPQPRRALPACPDWLDEIAAAKWAEVVPELDRLGVLTAIDGDALVGYCLAWSELQHATETLAAEGRQFSTDKGYIVQHPAVAQQRSAMKALKDFSSLFGLDPFSRMRIKIQPKSAEEDEMEKFLKESGNGRSGKGGLAERV